VKDVGVFRNVAENLGVVAAAKRGAARHLLRIILDISLAQTRHSDW
jgi:hypothetical protein